MKKFFKVLLSIACAAIIGFMGYSLYETREALEKTTEQLEDLSYTEGKVDEGTNGDGVVTVSGDWLVFNNDQIIKAPETNRSDLNINSIYSELLENNLIASSDGTLIKLKYSSKLETSITERPIFLVGEYYITFVKEG